MNEKQWAILDFIADCQTKGFSPSYKEIGDKFGYKSVSGVQYQLKEIEAAGQIKLTKGAARRIELRYAR